MAEVAATFVLVNVILGVKYYHQGPGEIKFFLIGLTLCGLITAIGPITGASINPAVGLVQPIFQSIALDGTADPQPSHASMWIHMVGPTIGALLAGIWTKID